VVNADYGVRANEFTPVEGAPVEVIIPWRHLLFPVLKNGRLEESGNG
jgi:hypothetical protein